MKIEDYIITIPNYPKEGIMFKDITPILREKEAFKYVTEQLAKYAKEAGADVIVGPESRGFIFGCPVAYELGVGFVPARKPGKLPRETVSYKYTLEYGENEIEIHKEDIKPGQKVFIIDDLLATGGTVECVCKLVESLGAEVVGCGFVIELVSEGLNGREKLKDYNIHALVKC